MYAKDKPTDVVRLTLALCYCRKLCRKNLEADDMPVTLTLFRRMVNDPV